MAIPDDGVGDLEAIFRSFDIEDDGYLDVREFMSLIGIITATGSLEKKLTTFFTAFDADDSGSSQLRASLPFRHFYPP